ncbi:MAG: DUF3987 domain-containing protein [Urechidicola sp.]|nr:DUF3987 domain-containing protein [Urechidicola sp.]
MKKIRPNNDVTKYTGLSKSLYQNLPNLLKEATKLIKEPHEKDLVLLATLVLLSNIIRVSGIYDSRRIFPNLFLFITAKASAGKGVLKWVKILGDEIHKELELKYKVQILEYKQLEDKSNIEKPTRETFFIPGNASLSAMIRQLTINNGYGVIVESEADTLNVAMKNDWGNLSELFRKAYEFESISQLRADVNNSFEIDAPRLSIVITGTQNQLLDFIPSVENGLFSRFMFMEFPLIKTWKNVFANKVDFYTHYNDIAKQLLKVYKNNNKCLNVSLSSEQEDKFHVKFSTYQSQHDALLGEDVISSIRRIGNMHFRICMLLTGLRYHENKSQGETAICTDKDFEIANEIIIYLLDNLRNIYGYIPTVQKATKNLNLKQALLYDALDTNFSFFNITEESKKLGIAYSTAENYLRMFRKIKLVEKLEHGKYCKIKI